MFRLMRAVWGWFTGLFTSSAERLAENRHVMAASYDNAIQEQQARFNIVRNNIAELITIKNERTAQIKTLGNEMDTLKKIKDGAHTAMQNRINALRAAGKEKEDILKDGDFIRHKTAFEDASKKLAAKTEQFDQKNADLQDKEGKIAKYKGELESMQRKTQGLREEKQEALADVALAKQEDMINSALAGIPEDSTDRDLEAARQARNRAVNRAKVTAELAGASAAQTDSEYLKLAEHSATSAELDSLLKWGDEPAKDKELDPAKLPES